MIKHSFSSLSFPKHNYTLYSNEAVQNKKYNKIHLYGILPSIIQSEEKSGHSCRSPEFNKL
jgi:hypothetical protein